MQACRDAARDVQKYVDITRWAHGVRIMHNELRKLRKVFKEMVKFVADIRTRTGGAPPMSMTLDLGTDAGIAALPAILAGDIQALLAARGGKNTLRMFNSCWKKY